MTNRIWIEYYTRNKRQELINNTDIDGDITCGFFFTSLGQAYIVLIYTSHLYLRG